MTALIGADFSNTFSTLDEGKGFGLGDLITTHDGKAYVFARANGAVTGAGYVCFIDASLDATMISTSNDAYGQRIGVAMAAFADNDYGWFQIGGPCVVRVAASAAANARLNTTATAGQLDDDGTAGAFPITGLALTTANGGSAGTAAAILIHAPATGVVL